MSDRPTLRLYSFWRSAATYRIRVALSLKGLGVEETALDLDAGDQFDPAFLAINPEGSVPTLIDGEGPPLTQSMAILEYLEERYPDPALLPADLAGRARVRSLAALVAADTHPLIVPRVRNYLTQEAGMDPDAVRAWVGHWVRRGLAAYEARLARDAETGAFCHGDTVTFADPCLCSLAVWAKTLGVDVAAYPTVARIAAACEAIDAFAAAHPSRQIGALR